MENNTCETFNGYILEAREKPIIQMLEEIRIALMIRMQSKREAMQKWDDSLCPRAREVLERAKNEHRYWGLVYNGDNKFEIRQGLVGYVANFNDKTCTCRMWQISGIPCCHTISCCYYKKEDPESYVAHWFKTENFLKADKYYLQPFNGEKMWPSTGYEPFLPPLGRRMPGRPKKQRNKEFHEVVQSQSGQVTRKGRKMQCQVCKQYGHNKLTCRGPLHPTHKASKAIDMSRSDPHI